MLIVFFAIMTIIFSYKAHKHKDHMLYWALAGINAGMTFSEIWKIVL